MLMKGLMGQPAMEFQHEMLQFYAACVAKPSGQQRSNTRLAAALLLSSLCQVTK